MRRFESICREQEMPKSEVAGSVGVSFRRTVKYENSSVDLEGTMYVNAAQSDFSVVVLVHEGWIRQFGSYICAPSDKAINGNKDQSFSAAGSLPSSPTHSSISGPLAE